MGRNNCENSSGVLDAGEQVGGEERAVGTRVADTLGYLIAPIPPSSF